MNPKLKKCSRLIILLAPTTLMFLVVALPASAALFTGPIVPAECRSNAPAGSSCTLCHMGILAINLTTFLMESIAFPAAILLVTISGLTLLTSGASEERRTLGKKILTSTVIGLIIVMLAWLGVDTIIKVLTGGSGEVKFIETLGPWNKIDLSKGCPL